MLGRPKRKTTTLEEVTVTSSKVMFYHKGDTLIYNADSFILAEGSTLDALLRRLPGVKLDRNGVITVNGRRVDALLLNGKNLFNNNNQLMLDNLEAYIVKDIAVYDKSGRASELMNSKLGDSKHVMDVRLKRQYSIGLIGNVEGGYGASSRYLAKLFGMWFSDNVSMSVYGSTNNLTDESKPGERDGAWSRDMMGDGEVIRKRGGMTYNAKGNEGKWELEGGIDVSHSKRDTKIRSFVENYFESGSVFNQIWQDSWDKTLNVSSDHLFYFKLTDKSYLEITPKFHYDRSRIRDNITDISLNENITGLSQEIADAIYNGSETFREKVISRQISESHYKGNTSFGSVKAETNINAKSSGVKGLLTLIAEVQLGKSLMERNVMRDIYSEDTQETPEKFLQKINHPDDRIEFRGEATYSFITPWKSESKFPITYSFRHQRIKGEEILKQDLKANVLSSWWESTLPFDPSGSYTEEETDNEHSFESKWSGQISVGELKPGKYKFMFIPEFSAKLGFIDRNYHFCLSNDFSPLKIHKLNVLPSIRLKSTIIAHHMTKKKKIIHNYWTGNLLLEYLTRGAPMGAMVDRPSSDPLIVMMGNDRLKDPSELVFSFSASKTVNNGVINTVSISYREMFNSLARGVSYDLHTGMSIYKDFNINGNRSVSGSYTIFYPFTSRKRFDLTSRTIGSFVRSIDFSGTEGINNLNKRNIGTTSFGENLRVNWHSGRHQVSAHVDGRFNTYSSRDRNFSDFSSWTCSYGGSAILNFPQNWGISSDIILYTRRGFADTRLNTTDLVWNVRLTKSLFKGTLVFVADAYDLLHQLSNVVYTVNAQARTETVSNVIPSYILFHIQWRLSKRPVK